MIPWLAVPIVAPNRLNTLGFPLLKLRLLKSKDDALVLELPIGAFEVYVPSNHGGELTIGFGKERLDPEHTLVVDKPDGTRVQMAKGQRVEIDIAPGQRGDGIFRVYVHAPSGAFSIYARFEEVGFAREKNGRPLVPWNFWFFPYSHADDGNAWAGKIVQPLERYAEAFGTTAATAWELEHHGDPTKTRKHWEGHCHDAAGASILFVAPPDDGIEHNGVKFRCEELKFYATEFFGQFGEITRKWALPGTSDSDIHGPYIERQPHDFPELFGRKQALGDFVTHLRAWIRDLGQAVRMDLRDENGDDYTARWNHAVYRYRIAYWQADIDDLGLVTADLLLSANGDFLPGDGSSSGLPAYIYVKKDGTRFPFPNGSGRDHRIEFVMRFDADGVMDPLSADNRWTSMRRTTLPDPAVDKREDEKFSSESFAPRSLSIVSAPRAASNINSGGNPHIERTAVLAMLQIRDGFR
jgi:hypothetical protein